MNFLKHICIIVLALVLISSLANAQQEIPESIKGKITKGIQYLENSKVPADMDKAIIEFTEASEIAPEYADVHYFLGKTFSMMQGYINKAVKEYRLYLGMYPDAPDKDKVNKEIADLEVSAGTKNISSYMGITLVKLSNGIFISRVYAPPVIPMDFKESVAFLDLISELNKEGKNVIGRPEIGDKIVMINGTDIEGYSLQRAMNLIDKDNSSDKYWRLTISKGGEIGLLLFNKSNKLAAPIIKELSDDNLSDIINKSKKPLVILFVSDWCQQCESVSSSIRKIAVYYKDSSDFITVNTEDRIQTAKEFNVNKVPMVLLYKKGVMMSKITEEDDKTLLYKIDALSPNPKSVQSYLDPDKRKRTTRSNR